MSIAGQTEDACDLRPVVAHCASPFLEPTTVWIHDQIRLLARYRPIVVTQAVRNRETFPVDRLVDASGRGVAAAWRRLSRKLSGMYAGYGEILRASGTDLVHAHFGQEGFRCLKGKRRAGVPMATTFYGLDVSMLPRQAVWRKRFDVLFTEGEMFLAEGPFMAQALVDLGCPQDHVRVQNLGVDLTAIPFRGTGERGDVPLVLMYASLREKKGHVYGLRAFARIRDRHPGARVDIIGDGPLREGLEREAADLGIAECVTFLGMRPRAECFERLADATVLLYPSVTASDGDTEGGAPVGLIEAMASGLPVVSSRHADIPAVVPEERCGLLAAEGDVDALAAALDALLGDAGLRTRLSEAGRAHVEAEHNLVTQVRRLEGVYDALI